MADRFLRRIGARTVQDDSGIPVYQRVPTPQNPIPARPGWGLRDGRGFGVAYDPAFQEDQRNLEQVRRETAGGVVPFDEVIRYLDAHNLPPQLVQACFIAKIPAAGIFSAQLLVPKNPNRLSLIVSNMNPIGSGAGVVFAYNSPASYATNGAGTRLGAGIPLPPSTIYAEANGSVAINNVFVFCNDETQTFPIAVCAYEGTLSPAGNRR